MKVSKEQLVESLQEIINRHDDEDFLIEDERFTIAVAIAVIEQIEAEDD